MEREFVKLRGVGGKAPKVRIAQPTGIKKGRRLSVGTTVVEGVKNQQCVTFLEIQALDLSLATHDPTSFPQPRGLGCQLALVENRYCSCPSFTDKEIEVPGGRDSRQSPQPRVTGTRWQHLISRCLSPWPGRSPLYSNLSSTRGSGLTTAQGFSLFIPTV